MKEKLEYGNTVMPRQEVIVFTGRGSLRFHTTVLNVFMSRIRTGWGRGVIA